MKQATANQTEWASSSALGLFGFGLTTILLQFHNLGIIQATLPVVFGLVWGGAAQVIAGIIAGKRGDLFHLTAFTSYGVFWIGLALSFVFNWQGLVQIDKPGYAWTMFLWGIFTLCLTIATFKADFVSVFVFVSLTILFFLLTMVFLGHLSAKVAGVEGLFCGAAATYGGAAIVINDKFGRTVLPLGKFK
jgi:uncharacterized protein